MFFFSKLFYIQAPLDESFFFIVIIYIYILKDVILSAKSRTFLLRFTGPKYDVNVCKNMETDDRSLCILSRHP